MNNELVFFLFENQVMANSKPVNGEYVKIFDYEPSAMAALVTSGNLKIGRFQMYREACKDYARLHGNLDEVRQQRYERVVKMLELLSSQEVA